MRRIVVGLLMFVTMIGASLACEIEFETLGEKKEVYHEGDVIVIKIELLLTHRNCPEGLEATKYSYPGFKVLGATKWEEVKPLVYERKFKLEVLKPTKGEASFSAVRTCHKEGGNGVFKVKVE